MRTVTAVPRRLLTGAFLIVGVLLLVACAQSASETLSAPGEQVRFGDDAAGEAEFFAAEPSAAPGVALANTAGQQQPAQDRLIIRTGNLQLVVEDTEARLQDIANLAAASGGWVVSSNVFDFDNEKHGDISLRIPAERFDEIRAQIKSLAVTVESEATTGTDVTEEFVDLSAQLENLEATAARVRGFLEETRNVEEALAVNVELSRLESEIERIKGRMQYLSQSAAFSTLHVGLTPEAVVQPLEVGGWQPRGVARDAVQSLVEALEAAGTVGIWLVLFALPLLLLLALPVYALYRVARSWRARRAPRPAES